jgi:RND family efflux transporter MFP subunit
MKLTLPVFICVVALTACSKETPPPAKIEQPALTQIVGASASDSSNIYSGEIRARHETQLGFRVAGKVIERLVDVGSQVKVGQVLASIDAVDSSLQASSAEAQLQLAEADAKRYRDLFSKKFVSQSALDAKETMLKSAAAQAGLAKNQSAYTTLHADHAGVISAILAEVGQVVSAGQPVVHLAERGEREVLIAVPESQFSKLKIGAVAEVMLSSDDDTEVRLSGRLRELSPAADAASRTYAARIALTQSRDDVALGMTAKVRFVPKKNGSTLVIPLTAIFQQGDQAAVWIVAADHSISLRPIKIAAYRDAGAVVNSGLVAGERIVSAGVHKLNAGEKIHAIENGLIQTGAAETGSGQ